MNFLRRLLRFALLAVCGASGLRAQWKTETYTLHAGWNGIYLHGDASYATPAEIFKAYPTVDQVWRWNPNPDQIQFSSSPAVPDATSSEWTIWNRNDSSEQMLTAMIGQSSYLIHTTDAPGTTISIAITQKPKPPAASWLVTGANFIGVPADADSAAPTFTNYFATFPIATTYPSKIYKYVGGELSASNPIEVTAFGTEKVDRNTAYWYQAATVGSFTGLVAYEMPGTDGLAFGRTGSAITVGVTNRSGSALTLTLSLESSEPAPTGQTGITGGVPLTYRVLDSTTGLYTETPITGSISATVAPNGRLDLQFDLDRSKLTGSASALYASLLRIKDSAKLTDVFLPVSAQTATPSGLWIGEIKVSTVVSTVAGSPGATTARYFPLRSIIHVDSSGTARLLSQAFVGTLAGTSTDHPFGICTKEAGLWANAKSSALRLVSSQMPLDRVITGTGDFRIGTKDAPAVPLTFVVDLPFDDATNPFVHIYHPDHDNRDARFAKYTTPGAESYTITRTCTLTFTAQPPDGSAVSGWGTTIFGGTYTETITGLNKQPLVTGGTFAMRRVSEIADITLN